MRDFAFNFSLVREGKSEKGEGYALVEVFYLKSKVQYISKYLMKL